ncbi:MAG TPA: sialidase family protein [Candidatus Thermoplasmatota archaeon]|nr:sialidase family protein [Candidatus Thermoplasmatota archaeon]
MRRPVPVLLAAALVAGCLGPTPSAPDDAVPPALGFRPDCSIASGLDRWPDPCTARVSWNEAPAKTEIDLAVNPLDPNNVVVASKDLDPRASNCVWSVAQVTKDGGRTWKTVYVGGDRANREPVLVPYSCVTDPILVFDANGVLYYALQAYRWAVSPRDVPSLPTGWPYLGSAFVLAVSRDGGETWGTFAHMAVGDAQLVFHDYPRMVVNPATNSVHSVWNGWTTTWGDSTRAPRSFTDVPGQYDTVSVWAVTARSEGREVDRPVNFFAPDAPRTTQFFGGLAADAEGRVYVTVVKSPLNEDQRPAVEDVFLYESVDDGRSFQEVGRVFSYARGTQGDGPARNAAWRAPVHAELAADLATGRLYAAYTDEAQGHRDVHVRWSDDRGRTWSEPARANLDETANDQFFPRIVVARDGAVHVLYYDRAFDPADKLLDASLATSVDGGATWTNLRLTASPFDGDLGKHQTTLGPFIGDYNGIGVASDGTVWTGWGDTRTGVAEVAVAKVLAP